MLLAVTNFIQDNENGKGVLAKAEGNFFAPKQKVYYLSVLSMIFLQISYLCALLKPAVCYDNHLPRHLYLSHSLFIPAQQTETILKRGSAVNNSLRFAFCYRNRL